MKLLILLLLIASAHAEEMEWFSNAELYLSKEYIKEPDKYIEYSSFGAYMSVLRYDNIEIEAEYTKEVDVYDSIGFTLRYKLWER